VSSGKVGGDFVLLKDYVGC